MIGGDAGNDTITGNAGADTIDGGAGNDTITGGAGADTIFGGLGADTFLVSAASDLAFGEAIDGTEEAGTSDTLRLNAVGTYNLSTFGTISNIDVITFNQNAAGFNLTVSDSQVSTADADGDGMRNDLLIDSQVAMTSGVTINASALTGTNRVTVDGTNLGGADIITGGTGDDVLSGAGGADSIGGGLGSDTITGGAGADALIGGLGSDFFHLSSVSDLVAGEIIDGTAEADTNDFLYLDAAGTYNLSSFNITNIDEIRFNQNAAGFNLTVSDSLVSTADADGDGVLGDLENA